MSRKSWVLAGLLLSTPLAVVGVTSIAGCGNSVPPKNTIEGGKPVTPTTVAVAPPPEAAFKKWSKPAAVLVLSGEQHGYLEPCGCSDTQSGGVSRRADLFRQIREDQKWPVAGLDLGGMPKRERKQSHIKFDTMRAALADMGYVAQAIGPDELRLQTDHLLAVGQALEGDSQKHLPFVSANVVLFDSPDLGTPLHERLVTVGDLKIGVTSVLDPALKSEIVPDGGTGENFRIEPMDDAIRASLGRLNEQKPDFLVLLAHAGIPASTQLAETFPEFDLIVSAGGPEEPDPKPLRSEKPMIVNVGHKGKAVGVLGIYPDDKKEPLKFELVNLDKWRFKEVEAMREHMRAYQQRLKAEKIAQQDGELVHPTGLKFVGAAKCGECHKRAYAYWKTTRHAHAYESLETGGKEYVEGDKKGVPFVARTHDAECLACHTTGWNPQEMLRYEGGYLPPEWVEGEAAKAHMKGLRGQQCENCHGPGSRHAELDEKWAADRKLVSEDDVIEARREVKLTLSIAKDKVCYKCHDADNSPKFKAATFDAYWEKVKHPWRD